MSGWNQCVKCVRRAPSPTPSSRRRRRRRARARAASPLLQRLLQALVGGLGQALALDGGREDVRRRSRRRRPGSGPTGPGRRRWGSTGRPRRSSCGCGALRRASSSSSGRARPSLVRRTRAALSTWPKIGLRDSPRRDARPAGETRAGDSRHVDKDPRRLADRPYRSMVGTNRGGPMLRRTSARRAAGRGGAAGPAGGRVRGQPGGLQQRRASRTPSRSTRCGWSSPAAS